MAPDLVTFNSLLNAWALSGTRCCGHKAESYLNQMWELYNAGDNNLVKPNDKTYNTVRGLLFVGAIVNELVLIIFEIYVTA